MVRISAGREGISSAFDANYRRLAALLGWGEMLIYLPF